MEQRPTRAPAAWSSSCASSACPGRVLRTSALRPALGGVRGAVSAASAFVSAAGTPERRCGSRAAPCGRSSSRLLFPGSKTNLVTSSGADGFAGGVGVWLGDQASIAVNVLDEAVYAASGNVVCSYPDGQFVAM